MSPTSNKSVPIFRLPRFFNAQVDENRASVPSLVYPTIMMSHTNSLDGINIVERDEWNRDRGKKRRLRRWIQYMFPHAKSDVHVPVRLLSILHNVTSLH